MALSEVLTGNRRDQDAIAVAGVAVGGAIAVATGEGAWDLWSLPLGLMLFLTLTGFVTVKHAASWAETRKKGAYALIVGLCVTIMTAWLIEIFMRHVPTSAPSTCVFGRIAIPLECAISLEPGEHLAEVDNRPTEPAPWSMNLVDLLTMVVWLLTSAWVYARLDPQWRSLLMARVSPQRP
jgi:hypothetical protein